MHIGSTEENTDVSLDNLVYMAYSIGASDIHLKHGAYPRFRIAGELIQKQYLSSVPEDINKTCMESELSFSQSDSMDMALKASDRKLPIVHEADIKRLMKATLNPTMQAILEDKGSFCTSGSSSPEMQKTVRLRMHYTKASGRVGVVMRLIPVEIPEPSLLNIPQTIRDTIKLQGGLVIVCGTQGQGKSTTLASLVEEINKTSTRHVVIIEAPAEFPYEEKQGQISQREIGTDSPSFMQALEDIHMGDVNVVVIGEVHSDKEMEIVLSLAEAGLLVYATIHSKGAAEALERVVNMFVGQEERAQYRLASVLVGVACQSLVKIKSGHGRTLATEILIGTPALRNIIRTGDFKSVENTFTSDSRHGNITMEAALEKLRQRDIIA